MKITLFGQSLPFWPSLGIIRPVLAQYLKVTLSSFQIREFDILSSKTSPPLNDDLWIFLPGTVHAQNFDWLRKIGPKKRPPILFFLNGEATKACFNLYHFRDVFGEHDVWSVSCRAEKVIIDRFFPENNRTFLTYYPIDTKRFKPSTQKFKREFGLPSDRKVLLYAGRLSLQKNILSLIAAVANKRNLHLVLCGDIDTMGHPHLQNKPHNIHYASLIFNLIKEKKLGDRVQFIPYQSQENLAKVMQSSDYQISLSSHFGEDFGYSIAQGLGCGLPTVLSKWGGHMAWEEILNKKSLVMLNPNEDRSLTFPTEGPSRFNQSYLKVIRCQLDDLLKAVTIEKKQQLKPHKSLDEFWQKSNRNKRSALFSGTENEPVFRAIMSCYSGDFS